MMAPATPLVPRITDPAAETYRELAVEAPGETEELRRKFLKFAEGPDRHGQFLRGAADGRARYLVPESPSMTSDLCAVVEIAPGEGAARMFKLIRVPPSQRRQVVDAEIKRAERAYGI